MEEKNCERKINQKLAIGFLVIFSITVAVCLIYQISSFENEPVSLSTIIYNSTGIKIPSDNKNVNIASDGIKTFISEDDFKKFLSEAQGKSGENISFAGGMRSAVVEDSMVAPSAAAEKGSVYTETAAVERVSETNVQVAGIDEPDIVKTDGQRIYFSPETYWGRGVIDYDFRNLKMIPPSFSAGETNIIAAFPPKDMAKISSIDKQGNLLLSKNILAIFSNNQIYGYNVADPKNPREVWKIRLEDNNDLVGSRLYDGKIYLVVRSRIDVYHPCPIKPVIVAETSIIIQCADIYHPEPNFYPDVVYSAMRIDSTSGAVEKSLSFVGASGSSVVYMSQNGIFVTWGYYGDYTSFYFNFLQEKGTNLVPKYVVDKIGKLTAYDISNASKFTEISFILENYRNSLDNDARMRFDNEMTNRMAEYAKIHRRDLERTGIVKIGIGDFSINAAGNVPGKPLNQFALDEYEKNLRIATTVGGGWGLFGSMGESANDIYVLDQNLSILGSIQDLGLTERIYAARFIDDKGYVVTFRQTDPFYVIDLSDPRQPEMKGELKMPGYSAYLHPITKDKILGIGKEDWKVKISLFDVSLPAKPQEIAKYILDENWTEAENNHHAFLLDPKNEIFFLPGSKGGYIFSYAGNRLELKKTVSGTAVKRAIYINDYLYIIGEEKITVIAEISEETVKELLL